MIPREQMTFDMLIQLNQVNAAQYPMTSEEQLMAKDRHIRLKYLRQMQELIAPYMNSERETWFTQVTEAEAWLVNPLASVPMITAIAAARGTSLAELVSKIMENANLYRTAVGTLLGQQQAELDALYNPV